MSRINEALTISSLTTNQMENTTNKCGKSMFVNTRLSEMSFKLAVEK